MPHGTGLGAEHPLNHKVQVVFLVAKIVFLAAYFGVWGLDSFVFRSSNVSAEAVPVFVRLLLGVLSLIVGIYLVGNAVAVFGKTPISRTGKPKLVTSGVYAWVRHPMYLGLLLFLLAFFFTTFSLPSLLVWIGFFAFLDRVATHEERNLIRIVGEKYVEYQKQVPKWLMRINRESK